MVVVGNDRGSTNDILRWSERFKHDTATFNCTGKCLQQSGVQPRYEKTTTRRRCDDAGYERFRRETDARRGRCISGAEPATALTTKGHCPHSREGYLRTRAISAHTRGGIRRSAQHRSLLHGNREISIAVPPVVAGTLSGRPEAHASCIRGPKSGSPSSQLRRRCGPETRPWPDQSRSCIPLGEHEDVAGAERVNHLLELGAVLDVLAACLLGSDGAPRPARSRFGAFDFAPNCYSVQSGLNLGCAQVDSISGQAAGRKPRIPSE